MAPTVSMWPQLGELTKCCHVHILSGRCKNHMVNIISTLHTRKLRLQEIRGLARAHRARNETQFSDMVAHVLPTTCDSDSPPWALQDLTPDLGRCKQAVPTQRASCHQTPLWPRPGWATRQVQLSGWPPALHICSAFWVQCVSQGLTQSRNPPGKRPKPGLVTHLGFSHLLKRGSIPDPFPL